LRQAQYQPDEPETQGDQRHRGQALPPPMADAASGRTQSAHALQRRAHVLYVLRLRAHVAPPARIAHNHVITVNATLTITTTQPLVKYSDFWKPAPASQNRCRMPLHRCRNSENVQQTNRIKPIQLPQNSAKVPHAPSPAASATKPHATNATPAHRNAPVTRCKIDSTIVIRHS